MILFVFEGLDDNSVMNTLAALYPKAISEDVVCIFENNIHQLYSKMKSSDSDPDFTESILSVLKKMPKYSNDSRIVDADEDTYAQTFLFFDYEPQHHEEGEPVDLAELNKQIDEMLQFFDDETGNGKLYVSYPMVEALFYTKSLPDSNFCTYTVPLTSVKNFKNLTHEFMDYGSQDFLLYNVHELYGSKKDRRRACVADNWRYVIFQNVAKANYICSGVNEIPQSKESVCQDLIFHNQLTKYVDHGCVAILSAYPMFLFEYLKYTLINP